MKKYLAMACLVFTSAVSGEAAADSPHRIVRETDHELRTLPNYGVFDILQYRVAGNDVTLLGRVTREALRSSAEKAIKSIEGVGRVVNQIEVLPLSSQDDAIRLDAYRAIYGHPSLSRYSLSALLPIHIIVKNGTVELIGVVSTLLDHDVAIVQAKGVSGVYSVKDSLEISAD